MNLSKKIILVALFGLLAIFATSATLIFISVDGGIPNTKTANIFLLIFSLVIIIASVGAAYTLQKDMSLEMKHSIILFAVFFIGLFYMIASSISIDYTNNPMSITVSGGKATLILPAITNLIVVPAIAGTGFILAN